MITIVVLAAGSSSRLGKPKQNLVFKSRTLLQRLISVAIDASDKVLVVLGANFDEIQMTVKDTRAEILFNEDWALGMSSSIKRSIAHIEFNHPETTAVMFLVCDQPFVNTELLKQLIVTSDAVDEGIVGCNYNDTVGVPAIFSKIYFPELLKLNGREGAKKILEDYFQDVYSIPFPLGNIDIDTEEDYNRLLTRADK